MVDEVLEMYTVDSDKEIDLNETIDSYGSEDKSDENNEKNEEGEEDEERNHEIIYYYEYDENRTNEYETNDIDNGYNYMNKIMNTIVM